MAEALQILSNFVVEPAIECASTLPSSYYVDPGLLTVEKHKVFWRTWQIVGRSEQVRNSGDYITADLLGEPLVVVRGSDGVLRGFYNVCRHRAGPAAEGCGSRKVFRCLYHGWTYGLDGRLINAPEMEGTENFCAEDLRLRAVQVGEWEGQVFVNLNPSAPPLIEALRELPEQAGKYRFGEMKLRGRREYHMQCNWKVYIDNYLE
ncbi:MAG: aromatic ring-hydroxylating dioxygenase subunit alpha, partial [Acidobacteriaceae bacterium]|nr:aromatic ring-hydroxylating dioxygenase subunit alpha [Acidobacteriaceae bacterium]